MILFISAWSSNVIILFSLTSHITRLNGHIVGNPDEHARPAAAAESGPRHPGRPGSKHDPTGSVSKPAGS